MIFSRELSTCGKVSSLYGFNAFACLSVGVRVFRRRKFVSALHW